MLTQLIFHIWSKLTLHNKRNNIIITGTEVQGLQHYMLLLQKEAEQLAECISEACSMRWVVNLLPELHMMDATTDFAFKGTRDILVSIDARHIKLLYELTVHGWINEKTD
jgi:hypothetical protein